MKLHNNEITINQGAFSISESISENETILSYIGAPKISSNIVEILNNTMAKEKKSIKEAYVDRLIKDSKYSLSGTYTKNIEITNEYSDLGEPLFYYSKISLDGNNIESMNAHEVIDEYGKSIKSRYKLDLLNNLIIIYHSFSKESKYTLNLSFNSSSQTLSKDISFNNIYEEGELTKYSGLPRKYSITNGRISVLSDSSSLINHKDRSPREFEYELVAKASLIRNTSNPFIFNIGVVSNSIGRENFLSVVRTYFLNNKKSLPSHLSFNVEFVSFGDLNKYQLLVTDNGFDGYTEAMIDEIKAYLRFGGRLIVDYTMDLEGDCIASQGDILFFNLGSSTLENTNMIDNEYLSSYQQITLSEASNMRNIIGSIQVPIMDSSDARIKPIILYGSGTDIALCKTKYIKGLDTEIKGEVFISSFSMFRQVCDNTNFVLEKLLINILASISSNLYFKLPNQKSLIYHLDQLFNKEYEELGYELDISNSGDQVAKLVINKDIEDYISNLINYKTSDCSLYIRIDANSAGYIEPIGGILNSGEYVLSNNSELAFYSMASPNITLNVGRNNKNLILCESQDIDLSISIDGLIGSASISATENSKSYFNLRDLCVRAIPNFETLLAGKSKVSISSKSAHTNIKFYDRATKKYLYNTYGMNTITYNDIMNETVDLEVEQKDYSIVKNGSYVYTISPKSQLEDMLWIEDHLSANQNWYMKIRNLDLELDAQSIDNYSIASERALRITSSSNGDIVNAWRNKILKEYRSFRYRLPEYSQQYFVDGRYMHIEKETLQYVSSNIVQLSNENIDMNSLVIKHLSDTFNCINGKLIASNSQYRIEGLEEYSFKKIRELRTKYGRIIPKSNYSISSDGKYISFSSIPFGSPFYIDALLVKLDNVEFIDQKVLNGKIQLLKDFKYSDKLFASYNYEMESLEYRGYYDDNGVFIELDLNPSTGHTYSEIIIDSNGRSTYSHNQPSKNLINKSIYFYLLPYTPGQTTTIKHTFYKEDLINQMLDASGILYLGSCCLSSYISPLETYTLDIRTIGGGLNERGKQAMSENLPLFWDSQIADSTFCTNAIGQINLPKKLLIDNGGVFTVAEIEAIVGKHLTFGVYPIIKFY